MELDARELRLVRPLDSGDLATVFAAVDLSHGNVSRAVALLHPDLEGLDEVIERMQARIQAARVVAHPGHVQTEGIFDVSGRAGVVMQYVDGKNLERIAKRKAVPGSVAARLALGVVDLLEAAASHNLLHGHLCPTRIIVTADGSVRVLGLGMRKGGDVGVNNALYREDRSVHRYAPPEGLNGLVTSAVDVYSLGSIITRIVSGRWPKRASQHGAGQATVIEGAAHVMSGAGASPELVGVVRDCLGFRADLRPYLSELRTILTAEAIDDAGWAQWLGEHVLSATDNTEMVDERSGSPPVKRATSTPFTEPDLVRPEMPDEEGPESSLPEPERSESTPSEEASKSEGDDAEAESRAAEPADDGLPLERLETNVHEPTEIASFEADDDPLPSKQDAQEPPTLGALPPPSARSSEGPLAVTGGEDLDTECSDDPDTVDEPTEEAGRARDALEVDAGADRWDRMLGLDVKVQDELDKEWLNAARGGSPWLKRVGILGLALAAAVFGVLELSDEGLDAPPLPASVDAPANPTPEPAASEPAEATAEPAPPPRPPEPAASSAPEPIAEPDPVPAPLPSEPPVGDRPEPDNDADPAGVPEPSPNAPAESAEEPIEAPEAAVSTRESEPAPPPSPATAVVRVTGDAHGVSLLRDGAAITSGRVPPGTYSIMVEFRPGDAPKPQGTLVIDAGESAVINCKAAFYRCTTRGPWK